MNIKAIIPTGLTEVIVHGLHQWDYGRKLEIHSPDLPAVIEVHFACAGMDEAVVRSCSVTNGVAVAAIPDRCLEQTTPITAWVYELDGTSGATTLKISLVVEPRTRPCPSQEIPEDLSDKYTEAVAAMNEAVAALVADNVTVARAIADENGKNIPNTYATKEMVNGATLNTDILAKAEELAAARQVGVHWFRLGGGNYAKDENGKAVNLPHRDYCYGFATVYVWWDVVRVYLWGDANTLPVCYNSYITAWSGWTELVDANNIGDHTANLVQRADMVYSMKKTLSSVQLNTEYVLGTMPDDLWGDGGSYIDPNESVLKLTVRLHSPDVELTASSDTNATKQAYQLQGFWWDPDDFTATNYRHYLANAVVWREGSEVRFKLTAINARYGDGSTTVPSIDGVGATVRVDFHRAVTTA